MALFISNVAIVVNSSGRCAIGVLIAGLAGASALFNISGNKQSIDHAKSSSTSQLIKGKSRDLQNLLKYSNGPTTVMFNARLLTAVLSIIFALCSKYLLACCCLVVVQPKISNNFISIIIQFASIIIPQTS